MPRLGLPLLPAEPPGFEPRTGKGVRATAVTRATRCQYPRHSQPRIKILGLMFPGLYGA